MLFVINYNLSQSIESLKCYQMLGNGCKIMLLMVVMVLNGYNGRKWLSLSEMVAMVVNGC